ncbi:MAG TPA: hypothetical protein VF326_10575 [Anaerolineaceae bacterium]
MSDQTIQWEYRVLTIGSTFGTRDENIEATLNEWGLEGWEVTHVYTPSSSNKVTLVAKKPLTAASRRLRTMP